MVKAPVIALSHGGGPMPILGDPAHAEIIDSMRNKVPKLLKLDTPEAPRAIVVVTAHWSEKNPTISSGKNHKLFYDYYGFPESAYKLKYAALGDPEIAQEVAQAMREEGLSPELNDQRGWDHGVFVPMLLINPSASVPIVQLSVLKSEVPSEHYRMGRALAKLRDSNVAVVGSGFASFHNLRLFFDLERQGPQFWAVNEEWAKSLNEAIENPDVAGRLNKLEGWREWPGAYQAHPRGGAEHFMPLLVVAGAAGEGKAKKYTDDYKRMKIASYYWD